MALDNIWQDEISRAVEVLGGEPQKYERKVEDKLTLKFTVEEWMKLFNVSVDYLPCGGDYKAYSTQAPIHIHFIRQVKEGT